MAGTIHYFGRVVGQPVFGSATLYAVMLHQHAPGEDARATPEVFRHARWPATNNPMVVRFHESEIEAIDDAALSAETEPIRAQE
jgi:hypothetical protein